MGGCDRPRPDRGRARVPGRGACRGGRRGPAAFAETAGDAGWVRGACSGGVRSRSLRARPPQRGARRCAPRDGAPAGRVRRGEPRRRSGAEHPARDRSRRDDPAARRHCPPGSRAGPSRRARQLARADDRSRRRAQDRHRTRRRPRARRVRGSWPPTSVRRRAFATRSQATKLVTLSGHTGEVLAVGVQPGRKARRDRRGRRHREALETPPPATRLTCCVRIAAASSRPGSARTARGSRPSAPIAPCVSGTSAPADSSKRSWVSTSASSAGVAWGEGVAFVGRDRIAVSPWARGSAPSPRRGEGVRHLVR